MMWGDGYGISRSDLYVISLMDKHRGWRQRADEMSETTKLFTILGTYINDQHGSRYYGKAMNITRQLTAAYDAALEEFDLLMMPTTPMKAQPLPAADASREEYVQRALEMIVSTSPFDISHHPAMAVPCGMSDGLPVSMMLIGKHFDEPTIYRAADAFERCGLRMGTAPVVDRNRQAPVLARSDREVREIATRDASLALLRTAIMSSPSSPRRHRRCLPLCPPSAPGGSGLPPEARVRESGRRHAAAPR